MNSLLSYYSTASRTTGRHLWGSNGLAGCGVGCPVHIYLLLHSMEGPDLWHNVY